MTDRIDLDELDAGGEADEKSTLNRGDWFWKGEGDPEDEPAPETGSAPENEPAPEVESDPEGRVDSADSEEGTDPGTRRGTTDATTGAEPTHRPRPRVPRRNDDRPVGIPIERGGGGGSAAAERERRSETAPQAEASGPHGGGADGMTLAFTYGALRRLSNPRAALADAERWTDWIGLVGGVDAHVLNKFQRDNGVDVDFFNGTGTDPVERLAEIDERSMFFAERMALVGVTESDEPIADAAGWEFVPLEVAAEKAGWEVLDD
ncbi:DUF7124 domain-containing protein [Halegenticoccus soli]|uniref:DUF7124 domain-containing protein n=1 Tax=Halegenticoccus soli TaxID=1985678 RepID=UPI000C6ED9CA|nr:hypothetical protein [Halegenticoccus soli]